MSEDKPNLETTDYRNANTETKGKMEMEIYRFLLAKYRMHVLHDNTIYFYENGIYREDGRDIIDKFINGWLGGKGSTHLTTEILAKICASCRAFKSVDELLEKKDDTRYDVCLENGILNIKTGEFKEHTPEEFFITKIPVRFVPDAKCLNIEKFLHEITSNNEDKYNLLIEVIGWCLLPNYYPHRIIALIGMHNNGKSTYIRLLKAFLGQRNCISLSVQEIEESPFARGELHNKIANLYADLDRRAIEHTGLLKQLTGEDMITGDRKFKDRITFTNRAKLVFSANMLPHFKGEDDTNAFFARWIIVHFLREFTIKTGENPHILEEICTSEEFSGLLNLAIVGAKKLLTNNQFSTDNISIAEKRERFLSISDVIPLFLEKALIQEEGKTMTRRELYNVFQAFITVTKTEFIHTMQLQTQSKFSRDFISYIRRNIDKYSWIHMAKEAVGKSVVDVWEGIGLNPDCKGLIENYEIIADEEEKTEIMKELPLF